MSLHDACKKGNLELVRELVENNEDDTNINAIDIAYHTPLYYACINNFVDIVCYLLDHGADMYENNNDWTLLHSAVALGRFEIVKILILRGINFNCRDRNGITPLHVAVAYEKLEIVKYLLENGADITFKARDGPTFGKFSSNQEINDLIKNWQDLPS